MLRQSLLAAAFLLTIWFSEFVLELSVKMGNESVSWREQQRKEVEAERAKPQRYSGVVLWVQDGDTVDLVDRERKESVRVRLRGIDSPERGQPWYEVAKTRLTEMVWNKEVVVHVVGRDFHGRKLGDVTLDGKDINLEMVRLGLAWVYGPQSVNPLYERAQAAAQQERIGLWSDCAPEPPWEFRKKQKQQQKGKQYGY